MTAIIAQMWILLMLAFAAGLGVGWWIWGAAPPPEPEAAPAPRAPSTFRFRDDGRRDDLTQIIGLDDDTEDRLNKLGVFSLEQIAGWTPANIAWAEEQLGAEGRVEEEHWVEQARSLLT